jgi:hypothetical protein
MAPLDAAGQPKTETRMIPVTIGGKQIRRNSEDMVCLNDMFAAATEQGLAAGKLAPKDWGREAYAKTSGSSGKVSVSGGPGRDFIDFVAENLKANADRIYKTTRGRTGGGTFAHWQIALAYAKYLSPELHMQVNDVYRRAQSGDVTLADEIADKATPADVAWLEKRIRGKAVRNELMGTLSAHGVHGKGFADCTNEIYKKVLGGKKSEVCAARGLRKSTNLRDVMTIEQIVVTEMVARKRIDKFNVRGNESCAAECSRAAHTVASLVQ